MKILGYTPELSVLIPCYNEKSTILEVIRRVKEVPIEKEIIVVSDGCTDGTRQLLKQAAHNFGGFRAVYHKRNLGKGCAIRSALKKARGRFVIIQDADLELDPYDYPELLRPVRGGKATVVFGSRFKVNSASISPMSRLGNFVVTTLANLLYGMKISDEACCYKVMPTELMRSLNLHSSHFDFCPEVTAKLRKRGYKICEVPVQFNPRTVSQGKKIGWKDGFEAVWTLIKYRFIDD